MVLDEPPKPAHAARRGRSRTSSRRIGWEVADKAGHLVDSVVPATTYHLRVYYQVLKPITGNWKAFVHIDGFQRRYNGDHNVLDGKYAMNLWHPGDVVVDDFDFQLEPNFTPGGYTRLLRLLQRRHALQSDEGTEPREPRRGAATLTCGSALDASMKTGYSLGMKGRGGRATRQSSERAVAGVDASPAPGRARRDRRCTERVDVLWSVDCETEDTFLYAAITNISEMGIFVRTNDPLAGRHVGDAPLRAAARPDPAERGLRARRRGAVGEPRAPARGQPQPGHGHPLREP